MTAHDQTAGFVPDNPYEQEAKERWGHTDAYKQSQERVKKMTKEDWGRIGKDAEDFTKKIADAMAEGKAASDPEVQTQIARHYAWLGNFYEPNLEMYRGLGSMYVDDSRFAAHYDNVRPRLAVFMRDAMHAFCDAQAN